MGDYQVFTPLEPPRLKNPISKRIKSGVPPVCAVFLRCAPSCFVWFLWGLGL